MSALNVGRRSAIGANLVGRCARMRTPSPIVLRRRRSRHPVRRIPWRPFPFKRHLAGEPARAVPCPGRSNGSAPEDDRTASVMMCSPSQRRRRAGSRKEPLTLTGRLAADAQIETPAPGICESSTKTCHQSSSGTNSAICLATNLTSPCRLRGDLRVRDGRFPAPSGSLGHPGSTHPSIKAKQVRTARPGGVQLPL